MSRWRYAFIALVAVGCRGGEGAPARSSARPADTAASEAGGRGAANEPSVGAIAGVVVDAAGRPVRGARVALAPLGLFDPSGARFQRVESAADGSFRLAVAPGRRYGVTATAAGHVAAWAGDVEGGGAGLLLRLGGAGRLLSGRVTDREGRPCAGAEVRLVRGFGERGDVFLTETLADGRWRAAVPDGDYHVNAAQADRAAAQRALPRGRDAADLVLEPVWPPGPPPPSAVEWLRAHEIALAGVDPGRGVADLAPLRSIVGDARVVGLGEATHGTREIFRLKHRALEFLVGELGFTVFAIEIGLAESFAIDDYVLGGGGDPERLLAGQSVAVWQTEELCDVVRWLRAWNQTHARKVRFRGLDMRTGVRATKEALAGLARAERPSPAAAALAPLADPFAHQDLVRAPAPELASLAAHARELTADLDRRRATAGARPGGEGRWRAAAAARALAQSLEWRAADDIAGRVRVRERAMAENALFALDHDGPDARAVVWAHNAHVAGDAAAEPRMAGVHLRGRLGAAYRAIGSALSRGAYQAVDPASRRLRAFEIAPAAPGSLEDAFAAGPPVAALDLRASPAVGVAAAWLHSFLAMRQFDGLYDDERPEGWAAPSALVTRDYDAILFVAEGTIARPLPAARAASADDPPPASSTVNLDLEAADAEGRPRAWLWSPSRQALCGYALALDGERPFAGRASARVERAAGPRYGECAGQLRQLVDAAPYRGARVRLRAAVRVERAGEHAHLYVQAGARRSARVASGPGWRTYDLALDVPADATALDLGLAFDGEGRAWLDAVTLAAEPP
jgi:erythromycin esterase